MSSLKNNEKYNQIKIKGKIPKTEILLFGISSPQKIHKLAWDINSNISIQLSKADDYLISDETQKTFALFNDISSPLKSFFLLENKIEDNILSKKYKNLDFFFIVTINNETPDESQLYLKSIKNIRGIYGVFIIEPCKDINKAFVQISL